MSANGKAAIMFDCIGGTTSAAELATLHLTLALHEHPEIQVVPKMGASAWVRYCSDQEITRFRASMHQGMAFMNSLVTAAESAPLPATLVRMLSDDLLMLPNPMERAFARNAGFASNTETDINRQARERGESLDLLIAGSAWQADLLRSAGLDNVVQLAPGFDGRRFHPGPRKNLFPGRFVIFSGGRLDFRKGQDLVIAAVREFRRRHPETLLIHAWQNLWPELIVPFDAAGIVHDLPEYVGGQLNITKWLASHGLPPESVVDAGLVSNTVLPDIVREAHVGLFPSRAEASPGTAMLECMASGVPCIVARNTGHNEWAADDFSFPLIEQSEVPSAHARVRASEGWGASSVEEIIAQLEVAYSSAGDTRRRAVAAARQSAPLGWHRHTAGFVEVLQPFLYRTHVRAAA